MQDAMDQAKFKCPRVRGQPVSKLWTKLYRPRLHVSGTWLHGRCFYLSVSDEDFCKDAVGEIEQLCRALDDLYGQHGTLPFGLSCHADNTYREFKNRHCIGFLILITALGIFRWTSASFLRVGHSYLIKPSELFLWESISSTLQLFSPILLIVRSWGASCKAMKTLTNAFLSKPPSSLGTLLTILPSWSRFWMVPRGRKTLRRDKEHDGSLDKSIPKPSS